MAERRKERDKKIPRLRFVSYPPWTTEISCVEPEDLGEEQRAVAVAMSRCGTDRDSLRPLGARSVPGTLLSLYACGLSRSSLLSASGSYPHFTGRETGLEGATCLKPHSK